MNALVTRSHAAGLLLLLACDPRAQVTAAPTAVAAPSPAVAPSPPAAPRVPIRMTYLGVAGWQIDAGPTTILLEPYLSRPDLDGPLRPDAAAIAAHTPAKADLVLVGHAHVDHVLDAPAVAMRTGADVLGSTSAASIARAQGLPDSRIITVYGGEDFAFPGYSVRVVPSLHAALDDKHGGKAEVAPDFTVPGRFADYAMGDTFVYLLRVGGHTIFLQSTANFIEREVVGLRPDIAVVAPGLRQEVHDYTCRLLSALGHPPLVLVTHFDDWRGPAVDAPVSEDLRAFQAEVAACSPDTRVVVPRHFEAMTLD